MPQTASSAAAISVPQRHYVTAFQLCQQRLACAALLLLPCSALNFGVSFTFGDAIFVLAAFLNIFELARLRLTHVLFILPLPLVLIANLIDPSFNFTTMLQMLYLFGFAIPFGWCAFSSLSSRQIAVFLLLSGVINSIVAFGQFWGLVEFLPSQDNFAYLGGELVRGAGLINNTTALSEFLNPLAPLLLLVRSPWYRAPVCGVLLLGLAATASKQAVVFIAACVVLVCLQRKRHTMIAICGVGLLAAALWGCFPQFVAAVGLKLHDLVAYRMDFAVESVDFRAALLYDAAELVANRPLLGYGTIGAVEEMLDKQGMVVHVHFLGVALSFGLLAALVFYGAIGYLFARLCKLRKPIWAAFLFFAMISIQFHPMMRETPQYLPLIVCLAVVVRGGRESQRNDDRKRDSSRMLNATS